MFKEILGYTQKSKYQMALVRMMLRAPEFFIPGNGKDKMGRGRKLMVFFLFYGRLYLNLTGVCSCLQQAETKYKWPNARGKIKTVLLG